MDGGTVIDEVSGAYAIVNVYDSDGLLLPKSHYCFSEEQLRDVLVDLRVEGYAPTSVRGWNAYEIIRGKST